MDGAELRTERLLVRTPRRGDGEAYATYYVENREFLQPWSPTFRPEMYSVREWELSIPVIHQQFAQGTAVRFGLWDGERLIGVANITDIKGSPLHGALLGYTLARHAEGKGLMFEALQAVMGYLFEARGLHRVSANYMPHNIRSGSLLRRLGFQVEGYARDYLLIDGKWEDHVLAAAANPKWAG